jgi:hypothetical protein
LAIGIELESTYARSSFCKERLLRSSLRFVYQIRTIEQQHGQAAFENSRVKKASWVCSSSLSPFIIRKARDSWIQQYQTEEWKWSVRNARFLSWQEMMKMKE